MHGISRGRDCLERGIANNQYGIANSQRKVKRASLDTDSPVNQYGIAREKYKGLSE